MRVYNIVIQENHSGYSGPRVTMVRGLTFTIFISVRIAINIGMFVWTRPFKPLDAFIPVYKCFFYRCIS